MTNLKQVREVLKPVAEAEPDAIFHKRWLIIVPIVHSLRGVLLDKMLTPEIHVPLIFAHPAFVCRLHELPGLHNWPSRLWPSFKRPSKHEYWDELPRFGADPKTDHDQIRALLGDFWRVTDEDHPHTLQKVIREVMLPIARQIETLDELRDYAIDRGEGGPDTAAILFTRVMCGLAKGDFDGAIAYNKRRGFNSGQELLNNYSQGLGDRLYEKGDKLSKSDKQAIIRWLHEHEEAVIKGNGLEAHWQPTPFPAEVNGLV